MNRYFDPATGRYTSVDPLGLLAGVNPYIYVLNNPLSLIDPTGLDWIYHQGSGQLQHTDSNGNTTNAGSGYAGYGPGLNNPAMQDVSGNRPNPSGPLPQGTYTIGPQQDNRTNDGHNLPGSMRLYPDQNNEMFDRGGFLIHGDNANGNNSASEGCPIFNRNIRNQIGSSGDHTLRVVP
jgi:uncharacterized protein RhaS with RHS repeats